MGLESESARQKVTMSVGNWPNLYMNDPLSALIAKYKLILEGLEQIQDTSNGDAKRDAGTYICLLLEFLVSPSCSVHIKLIVQVLEKCYS